MFGVNYAKQQFLVEIKIDIKIDFVHMFIFYIQFRTCCIRKKEEGGHSCVSPGEGNEIVCIVFKLNGRFACR